MLTLLVVGLAARWALQALAFPQGKKVCDALLV